MMRRWIILLGFLAVLPAPAVAEDVVADLSATFIAVTTGFTGANLTVFGDMTDSADVAIVVEGPHGRATIRRKSRPFGIWLNTDSFVFDEVPGYYAVATSRPAGELASPDVLAAHGLNLDQLSFPARREGGDMETFRRALIARKKTRGYYLDMPEGVHIISSRLFRADFPLPANVPIGAYKVHVYLLRNGQIAATRDLALEVDESGFSAMVLEAARYYPVSYAFAALMMALAMGAAGALLFRRMS